MKNKKLLTDNSNLILRIFIYFELKTSCLKQTDTPLYTYIHSTESEGKYVFLHSEFHLYACQEICL